jgi:hypothetical protein
MFLGVAHQDKDPPTLKSLAYRVHACEHRLNLLPALSCRVQKSMAFVFQSALSGRDATFLETIHEECGRATKVFTPSSQRRFSLSVSPARLRDSGSRQALLHNETSIAFENEIKKNT